MRVCVFIYGAMFFGLGAALASAFIPPNSFEWLALVLGLAISGFGTYLVHSSVFGRLQALEKAANAVSDGGELVGIVLVLLVFVAALPIAAIVKRLRSPRRLF